MERGGDVNPKAPPYSKIYLELGTNNLGILLRSKFLTIPAESSGGRVDPSSHRRYFKTIPLNPLFARAPGAGKILILMGDFGVMHTRV
jgi:hypothetical protein